MITSITMESFDLWIVHSESELALYGNEMLLSLFKLDSQAVQLFCNTSSFDIDQVNAINDDYSPLPWLEIVSLLDPFDYMFPTNESIMEVMNLDEVPWNDYHHRSSFLPNPIKIENDFSTMISPEIVDSP